MTVAVAVGPRIVRVRIVSSTLSTSTDVFAAICDVSSMSASVPSVNSIMNPSSTEKVLISIRILHPPTNSCGRSTSQRRRCSAGRASCCAQRDRLWARATSRESFLCTNASLRNWSTTSCPESRPPVTRCVTRKKGALLKSMSQDWTWWPTCRVIQENAREISNWWSLFTFPWVSRTKF